MRLPAAACLLLLLPAVTARGEVADTGAPAGLPAAAAREPAEDVAQAAIRKANAPGGGGVPEFSVVRRGSGLSLHRDNYILPLGWSPEYHGDESEFIFQVSIKQRLLVDNLYAGYTQKSLWQWINRDRSSPFRETNYNPEVFYRWLPGDEMLSRWHLDKWGFDAGFEHESNGREIPQSRSWNRVYIAPFRPDTQSLWYFKLWYRIPEDPKNSPLDPKGDDNPDIDDYYGYGEVTLRQALPGGWMNRLFLRGNPDTGKGAVELQLSRPSLDNDLFYVFSVFNGYGESLADYNDSMTRVALGVMFNR